MYFLRTNGHLEQKGLVLSNLSLRTPPPPPNAVCAHMLTWNVWQSTGWLSTTQRRDYLSGAIVQTQISNQLYFAQAMYNQQLQHLWTLLTINKTEYGHFFKYALSFVGCLKGIFNGDYIVYCKWMRMCLPHIFHILKKASTKYFRYEKPITATAQLYNRKLHWHTSGTWRASADWKRRQRLVNQHKSFHMKQMCTFSK